MVDLEQAGASRFDVISIFGAELSSHHGGQSTVVGVIFRAPALLEGRTWIGHESCFRVRKCNHENWIFRTHL
jgi:hypothetical protein